MALPKGITDESFLTAYKEAINTKQPDFVFVLYYNRIGQSIYTPAQQVKELAAYSKKKGVCTIAMSEEYIDMIDYDLADEFWEISPLIDKDDWEEMESNIKITIPYIYNFQASVDGFDFLVGLNDPDNVPTPLCFKVRESRRTTIGFPDRYILLV